MLFTVTAPTEIYTLSLHDALPIWRRPVGGRRRAAPATARVTGGGGRARGREGDGEAAKDRKSTRLNSSHVSRSYAVFCLKKKTSDVQDFIFRLRSVDSEATDIVGT